MSLIIKDMEMPQYCLACRFLKTSPGHGDFCVLTKRVMFRFKNRPGDCPLIELPPHGRLIDADEADSRYIPDFTDLTDYQQGWNDAMKRVCDNAPTIIEADREAEP